MVYDQVEKKISDVILSPLLINVVNRLVTTKTLYHIFRYKSVAYTLATLVILSLNKKKCIIT